jgi:hypothetical protein
MRPRQEKVKSDFKRIEEERFNEGAQASREEEEEEEEEDSEEEKILR